MAKCEKCGAEVLDTAKFCTECGAEMGSPFTTSVSGVGNPFEELDNSVPKPQAASELVFEELDWSKGEASTEAASKPDVSTEAAANSNASTEAASNSDSFGSEAASASWSGQSGYGKPAFDPNAEPVPEVPNFSMPNSSASTQQDTQWGAQQQDTPWGSQQQDAQWGSQQEAPKGNPDFFNTEWYQGSAQPVGNDKIFAILSYIFLIGWLLAFFIRDGGVLSEYRKQHLNQSLVLAIVRLIGGIVGGWIGGAIGLVAFAFAIMGIVYAARNSAAPLPGIGTIRIIK